jgi:hypothetical protein
MDAFDAGVLCAIGDLGVVDFCDISVLLVNRYGIYALSPPGNSRFKPPIDDPGYPAYFTNPHGCGVSIPGLLFVVFLSSGGLTGVGHRSDALYCVVCEFRESLF